MGKIVNNPVTRSFSGSFGDDVVFRQIGNRTFFAKKAVYVKSPTLAQQANRKLFSDAQNFASLALEDPQQSEWYSIVAKVNGLKTAQLAAIRDYMLKPEIENVDLKNYNGNIADRITIKPKMLLKIQRIEVSIYNATGALVESGWARKHELQWRYEATAVNSSVEASRIVLIAYDKLEKSHKVARYLS